MMYQPNFEDSRVQRRVKSAMSFSIAVMSPTKPFAWSTRYIDRFFGQQQHELGAYLRSVLLIEHDTHWNYLTGKCKQYRLNSLGVSYLREQMESVSEISWNQYQENHRDNQINKINNNLPSIPYCITSFSNEQDTTRTWDYRMVSAWCQREFGEELSHLRFNYTDKSDRLWHPMQNIRSRYRAPILRENGLCHQYDIATAAPTLLHRHAQTLGQDTWLEAVESYIKNKIEIRNQLSQELELPISTVKIIINSLFCGARIGRNPQFAISELLNNDAVFITALREHEFIKALRQDIRVIWSQIEPTQGHRVQTGADGRQRKVPFNSQRKWAVYFGLERQVMNSVRAYMDARQNRYFLEHDGWSSEHPVDVVELTEHVFQQTGYYVRFDYTQQ